MDFAGKKYILTDQADHTNRLLEWGWHNKKEHDGYYQFEMSCPAIDNAGQEYTVYWVFGAQYDEDGDPLPLDGYDYDAVNRVVPEVDRLTSWVGDPAKLPPTRESRKATQAGGRVVAAGLAP